MPPDATQPGTITVLLRRAQSGDLRARDEAFSLLNPKLRRLAPNEDRVLGDRGGDGGKAPNSGK